jgi:NADPH2 dehydrogenase
MPDYSMTLFCARTNAYGCLDQSIDFNRHLPYLPQAEVGEAWVDFVGLGRMVLLYPELLRDAIAGEPVQHKLICRTFSDCTIAQRNGLPSGCYPLDRHYQTSETAAQLKIIKTNH